MCHIHSAEVLKRAVSNMAVVRFTDRLVPGSFTRCERCTRESKFNNWPTAVQWIRFRRPVTVLPPLQLNTLWLWKLRFLFHRHKFSFSTFENVSERLSCQNIVCVTLYFKALSRSSFEVKIRELLSLNHKESLHNDCGIIYIVVSVFLSLLRTKLLNKTQQQSSSIRQSASFW